MESDESGIVSFVCVCVGSKLRIRITTPGYHNEANCQFPRDIREEGRTYTAPASAVKLAMMPRGGKYFYRVNKSQISIVEDEDKSELYVEKIYEAKKEEDEDKDCIVCWSQEYDVVIVPCGHYCLCNGCGQEIFRTTKTCPMCRGGMAGLVRRDEIAV